MNIIKTLKEKKLKRKKEIEIELYFKKKKEREEELYQEVIEKTPIASFFQVECRPFYDQTWVIRLKDNTATKVVFMVESTFESICDSLLSLEDYSIESIKALDERNKIYYD